MVLTVAHHSLGTKLWIPYLVLLHLCEDTGEWIWIVNEKKNIDYFQSFSRPHPPVVTVVSRYLVTPAGSIQGHSPEYYSSTRPPALCWVSPNNHLSRIRIYFIILTWFQNVPFWYCFDVFPDLVNMVAADVPLGVHHLISAKKYLSLII